MTNLGLNIESYETVCIDRNGDAMLAFVCTD